MSRSSITPLIGVVRSQRRPTSFFKRPNGHDRNYTVHNKLSNDTVEVYESRRSLDEFFLSPNKEGVFFFRSLPIETEIKSSSLYSSSHIERQEPERYYRCLNDVDFVRSTNISPSVLPHSPVSLLTLCKN